MKKKPAKDCNRCGFAHIDADEAEAMHDASDSVRAWFREYVNLSLVEVVIPGKKTIRTFGDHAKLEPTIAKPSDRKRGRGYDGYLGKVIP